MQQATLPLTEKILRYEALHQNFSLIHEDTIKSPDASEVSCCATNFIHGKEDDFFISVNVVLYYDFSPA